MSQAAVEHYLSQYAGSGKGPGASWLSTQKDRAAAILKDQGFPSTRVEDWRYTDVNPILKQEFQFTRDAQGLAARDLDRARIAGLDCYEMVFINGVYSAEHSSSSGLPGNIDIKPLARAIADNDDWVKNYLNDQIKAEKNGFVALNTAFIQDGAAIFLPDYMVLDKPLNLIYLTDSNTAAPASNIRNLLVLGTQAEASIIETYYGDDADQYFNNSITEVNLGEGAILAHYRLQQESIKAYHVGYMHVHQHGHSRFESHQVSLGSRLCRSDLDISLTGSGSSCQLNGLFMASRNQHVDHHTRVDHLAPHTSCSEIFRGVLGGRARGVFNGKIIVHKDAQKTDAHLSNANLLLSSDAEIDTKPELEIYADDVKCSHGATIGRLDDNMLFYLRTRAISKEVARSLLTFAFAGEVVSRIRYPEIRNRLEHIIVGRLPDADMIKEFIQ